jgi:hypothetical protein
MQALRRVLSSFSFFKQTESAPLTDRESVGKGDLHRYISDENLLTLLPVDARLYALVKQFATKEYSQENLEIYDQIQSYKKRTNHELAISLCDILMAKKWLAESVTKKIVDDCHKTQLRKDVFNPLEEYLNEILLDIIARFRKSHFYYEYLNYDAESIKRAEETKERRLSMSVTPRGGDRRSKSFMLLLKK